MVGAKLRIFSRGGGIQRDKSSASQWKIPLLSTSYNWVSSKWRNFFMILVWYSSVSIRSLCSLRFCRAQRLKQRLQKQPCNKFGLKAMKRSVKKLQKSTPALIVRPGIYGLGKAVNLGDVSVVAGSAILHFFKKIRPPLSFEFKIMLRIFPFPGIDHSRSPSRN